jgi:hypothetical protein
MTFDTDFKEMILHNLIAALSTDNFDAYVTSVGGSGLGILSPYGQHAQLGSVPVTPPETPNSNSKDIDANGTGLEALRACFETKTNGELAGWAEELGRWLFV